MKITQRLDDETFMLLIDKIDALNEEVLVLCGSAWKLASPEQRNAMAQVLESRGWNPSHLDRILTNPADRVGTLH